LVAESPAYRGDDPLRGLQKWFTAGLFVSYSLMAYGLIKFWIALWLAPDDIQRIMQRNRRNRYR
jgi:hypothetical protein